METYAKFIDFEGYASDKYVGALSIDIRGSTNMLHNAEQISCCLPDDKLDSVDAQQSDSLVPRNRTSLQNSDSFVTGIMSSIETCRKHVDWDGYESAEYASVESGESTNKLRPDDEDVDSAFEIESVLKIPGSMKLSERQPIIGEIGTVSFQDEQSYSRQSSDDPDFVDSQRNFKSPRHRKAYSGPKQKFNDSDVGTGDVKKVRRYSNKRDNVMDGDRIAMENYPSPCVFPGVFNSLCLLCGMSGPPSLDRHPKVSLQNAIRKVYSTKVDRLPSLKVFVAGNHGSMVARLLSGDKIRRKLMHGLFIQTEFRICEGLNVFSEVNDNSEDDWLYRKVAVELTKKTTSSELSRVIHSLAESQAIVYGLSSQTLAQYLKPGQPNMLSQNVRIQLITYNKGCEQICNETVHLMYRPHGIYIIMFELNDLLCNQRSCLSEIHRNLTNICSYADCGAPVLLVCVAEKEQNSKLIKEIGLLLQTHLPECFDAQLIYNESTNYPLFILTGDNVASAHTLKNAIEMLSFEQTYIADKVTYMELASSVILRDIKDTGVLFVKMSLLQNHMEKHLGQLSPDRMDAILQYLHDSGEILCSKFLPLNTCSMVNRTLTDMFVLLKPTYLIGCMNSLLSVPPPTAQPPNERLFWNHLVTDNCIRVDQFRDTILNSQSNAVDVIAFMELVGLVYPMNNQAETKPVSRLYTVPALFPPKPSPDLLEHVQESTDILYVDFATFLPLMVFTSCMHLIGQKCQEVGGHLVIDSATSYTAVWANMKFYMLFDSLQSVIKVCIIRECSEHNLKDVRNLVQRLFDECLPTRPQFLYRVGPLCPLPECLDSCSKTLKPHFIDLNNAERPIICGTKVVGNRPLVKKWMVQPLRFSTMTPLKELPPSLYEQIICRRLDTPAVSGNDWKLVAEHLGKTMQDVDYFATKSSPAAYILSDWCTSSRCVRLQDLLDMLEDIDRPDIRKEIMDWLDKGQAKLTRRGSTTNYL